MNGATLARALRAWFDTRATPRGTGVDWSRVLPYLCMHAGCVAVFLVGVSTVAVATAVALYVLRMFAITGFYHRYFSHRAFSTSRALQFLFALLGAAAVQRGPLWWAAHHRHHHAHADRPDDPHSPQQHGFLWAHTGWFMAREHFATRSGLVRDLLRYPELRFLDRYDSAVPFLLALLLYGGGELLQQLAPSLGTDGWQLLVWGFCISTVALYHATFTVNSLAHRLGSRRYATRDGSRNNWLIALLTLGEGWHNNHHHYPATVRQGFYWWEIDVTYYALRLLQFLGLVWDLKPLPVAVRDSRRRR
jgi:stearoyl-CoA desaturase (delta-9 desaturase)